MYWVMFNLSQERAHYRVEVTGLSIHSGFRKEFIVLNVKLDKIAEIRTKMSEFQFGPNINLETLKTLLDLVSLYSDILLPELL